MEQRKNSLANIQKFENVFGTFKLPGNIVEVFNIKGKRLINYLQKVLNYEGVGKLEIPGYVLEVIPKITNLAIIDVAEVLDISKSTYYRAKEEIILEMETVDKLSSVLKIYQRGLEAFEGDKEDLENWLHTKIPSLGNKKPFELLKTENGRQFVLAAIDRIEHSIYG